MKTRFALAGALALALALGPTLLLANPADAAKDSAQADKRLAEARARLEAAAREVAELAADAHGPGREIIRLLIDGDGRKAMIGVNLDSSRNSGGARVEGVSPGGPAAEAGVQSGDLIVAIDGKAVANARELTEAMKGVEPGQKLALDLKRDGKPVKVTVNARPMGPMMMMGGPDGPMQRHVEVMRGMPEMYMQHWALDGFGEAELVTLSPGLGRYFGADKGVLVARAPKDLGLQDGDVVTAIGGREPQNGPHAMRILRSYQPGEEIEFRILRDRKAQSLKVKAPESTGQEKRIERRRIITPPPKPPVEPVAPAEPARTG